MMEEKGVEEVGLRLDDPDFLCTHALSAGIDALIDTSPHSTCSENCGC